MSRKSRQPDAETDGGKKGKKGRKGKKGAVPDANRAQLVVETRPDGVPFAVVVLLAAVMILPSLQNYLDGGLKFDAMMMRVFAALAVSWLLSTLVWAVFESMKPVETHAVLEMSPEQAFHAVAQQEGALSGTIVTEAGAQIGDPFALDPVAAPESPAPLEPATPEQDERAEPAA